MDRRARLPDLGVTVLVAVAVVVSVAVASEADSRDPFPLGYLLALGVPALVPLRRRAPLGVLAGSMAVLFGYYALGFAAFSPAIPLAASAYFAAVSGRAVPAGALLLAVFGASFAYRLAEPGDESNAFIVAATLTDLALLAAVLLLGVTVRSRRQLADETRRRLLAAEHEREGERRLAAQQERLRIARELHDVLAHTVSALSVQAAVGADALDDRPEQARAALAAIRTQSRRAVDELRATLGVLRAGGPEGTVPVPDVGQLEALLQTARAAGLDVRLETDGPLEPLPELVGLAAFRIVQESLTNVVRHARAGAARVRISRSAAEVVVEVVDDGSGGPAHGSGHGLVGMAERAAALGGRLESGPCPGGGFRVRAVLPL